MCSKNNTTFKLLNIQYFCIKKLLFFEVVKIKYFSVCKKYAFVLNFFNTEMNEQFSFIADDCSLVTVIFKIVQCSGIL